MGSMALLYLTRHRCQRSAVDTYIPTAWLAAITCSALSVALLCINYSLFSPNRHDCHFHPVQKPLAPTQSPHLRQASKLLPPTESPLLHQASKPLVPTESRQASKLLPPTESPHLRQAPNPLPPTESPH